MERTFRNELGNTIRMNIVVDDRGVTVEAEGPTSLVQHTWTPMEATVLRRMLQAAEEEAQAKLKSQS